MSKKDFGIIGFPWDGGASLGRPGARFAPVKIREAFSWFFNRIENKQVYDVEKRRNFNIAEERIKDYGDIDIVAYSTMETFKNAEKKTEQALKEGVFPFVLGGDHSISYPIIKALHDNTDGNVGIIHFDAHLDLVDESPVQGKYSQSSQIRRALELPRIDPKHIVQIGVRSYNYPWYEQYLKDIGIVQITAREVHESTSKKIVNDVLDALKDVDKIYLTFDMDVLEPAYAPGVGANEPGGLTPVQCMSMLESLYHVVDAFDIAEVNPLYDHQDITTSFAARIMFDCAVSRFNQ